MRLTRTSITTIGGNKMKKEFDVIIVGGGPAGMFCAYEIVTRKPEMQVLIIEAGKAIRERRCPAQERKGQCVKCKICSITHGSSGAGAFSDGKLLLPHESDRRVRGNLGKHLTLKESIELYQYTDEVYLNFGATPEVKGEEGIGYVNTILKPYLQQAELEANCSRIRHLGTDGARLVYKNLEDFLKEKGVVTFFNTEVNDLIIDNGNIKGVKYCRGNNDSGEIHASTVVLAIGRSGTDWLEKMCTKHKIDSSSGPADLGVRYELPDSVMQDINRILYEGKFIGYPNPYRDKVRTFCQNPSGLVASESYKGELTLVNGHSLLTPASDNTNLALLVSLDFNGLENPIEVTEEIARSMNKIGKGQPVVQRLGDLRNGHRTTAEVLSRNSVEPTLKSAIPGDISLGMPLRVLVDILGFIDQMDQIAPGFADYDNLLYAPEIKFYSLMLKLSKNCETNIKGLYGAGDGSGPTHGLMPASVNGVFLGRVLVSQM